MYLKLRTHSGNAYKYQKFRLLFSECNSMEEIYKRPRAERKDSYSLTKEEFRRIDHLYGQGYKELAELCILSRVSKHRVRKYYFYNLK